ncbi:hypothetical protein [uncultured Roseobacter sp.]|uniref:hypothetical protein n=1 Tax=uncultured Roseobacter sp. TaxID=114847 RepID=UPI0026396BA0|nr:hypothetical protein [uncultured Roseobacter sp.]
MPAAFRLFAKLCVTATLLLAMTAVGFAHRSSQPPMDPDLLAFLDAGGTLEELCGLTGDAPGPSQNCEACRLVDTVVCPPHASTAQREIPVTTQRMRVIAQLRHHAKPLDPTRLTRAPPQA